MQVYVVAPAKLLREMSPDGVEDILRNGREYVDLWRRDYSRHGHPGFAKSVPVPKTGA